MTEDKVYDLVGIGFGPANLSVAIAVEELHSTAGQNVSAFFLEQNEQFEWHPDMLLDTAEMQVSFLKDLVTLRNPSSAYTFLAYLKDVGRLKEFANLRAFYPSRIEFNDYLAWAAKKLHSYASYSQKVISVTPSGNRPHNLLEVVSENTATGEQKKYLARNIIAGVGGVPRIPFEVSMRDHCRLWHSSSYLSQIEKYKEKRTEHYSFAVIGRGQSAAEITRDLHATFPNASVHCVYRGFSIKPSDDSEFVNEIFDPKIVDFLYETSADVRESILQQHADTNYAVVDIELIRELYRIYYNEKISGRQRLHFKNLTEVTKAQEQEDTVLIEARSIATDEVETSRYDAVIMATGYDYPSPPEILSSLSPFFKRNGDAGEILVDRYYRLNTNNALKTGIYLQGCNESTHGLSDTLLSVMAIRSQEILDDLLKADQSAETDFSDGRNVLNDFAA